MEPLLLILVPGGILLGVLVGALGARVRGMQERAGLAARVAAAEAGEAALRDELGRQRELQREAGLRDREERAAREAHERREQEVLRALAPVRDTLQTMQEKVDALERDRARQFGALGEQLRRAQESDEALRATTESLASALRSGSTRGVWGETQLRRVVEAAGLTRYVDFETQASVTTDAGAGRPDLVVRLPGDRALAVDAKVPLDAYLEASAIPLTAGGEEGARRRTLLDRHVKAVRAHVDALAKKTYWAGLPTSPEFVVCFIPSESLLAAALEEDPSLLDYAFGRRVALASPVNLWAVLKTVAYTWTQQDVSVEARRLFDLGTQLYERLGALAGHADDLRRAIERTVESYNRFAGSLESRVLVTARKFPGIDETRLAALPSPAPLDTAARRLTAPELIDRTGVADRTDSPDRAGSPGTMGAPHPTDRPEQARARRLDPNGHSAPAGTAEKTGTNGSTGTGDTAGSGPATAAEKTAGAGPLTADVGELRSRLHTPAADPAQGR